MVKIGDKVYVNSSFYLSHGSDDFVGGLATVTEVLTQISGGEPTTFIRIKESPRTTFNWGQHLSKEQGKLQKQFGNGAAHPDPDERPEFNRRD
jgi:hypothetical protein